MSLFVSLGLKALSLLGFIKPEWAKGWTEGAAKVAGIVVAVILLIAVLAIGKCAYDDSVIDDYEGEQAVRNLDARNTADEAAAEREAGDRTTELRQAEAAGRAAGQNPEAAAKPVGPVTQSYYDTLGNEEDEE